MNKGQDSSVADECKVNDSHARHITCCHLTHETGVVFKTRVDDVAGYGIEIAYARTSMPHPFALSPLMTRWVTFHVPYLSWQLEAE